MEINSKIEAANEIMGIIAKRSTEILEELTVILTLYGRKMDAMLNG